MSSLINNVLLKTHLLQTISQSNNGAEIVFKIDWIKTILHFIILLLVIIAAFILKSRYVRWKNRQTGTFSFPQWNQNLPFLAP